MRFLTFLALSFFISLNTYSQGWIDGGIKGGFGVTQLINQNVWDNSEVVNKISFGKSFGGKLGLNFNLNYQITVDFIYTLASQEFEFQPNNQGLKTRSKFISYNSFDIPLLFRRNSDNGSFLEIGPQISFIKNVEQEFLGVTKNMETSFQKTNFGAVVGIGSFMMGSKNLYLVFGLRAHYGFQDILSDEGGKNSNVYFPVNDGQLNTGVDTFEFESYKKTSPISLLAYLEVNYDLAYIVRSNCKRTALKFF
tara:strand:- start:1761 stop:2513 length:753 start_codon:yes stop_codon:yes gene_type:complete